MSHQRQATHCRAVFSFGAKRGDRRRAGHELSRRRSRQAARGNYPLPWSALGTRAERGPLSPAPARGQEDPRTGRGDVPACQRF